MATTYDKASLVMIPSGVKEDKLYSIKPTDGSGDFTFSRGSDIEATRVNSSGLIEKAKVNNLLQSNTFSSGTWSKIQSGGTTPTLTSGFSDPDGGSNAWRMQCSITGGLYSMISQSLSTSGLNCNSIYIKSNTGSDQDVYFRINNADQTTTRTATTSWQRIELFTTAAGQSFTIGVRDNATGSTSSCDVLIYAAQNNHGSIAQDYVETTTTAVVEGLTADLPRLDYSGGASCPSLLLEPSRTNYATQSEYIGAWVQSDTTSVDNFAVSPEGVQNASKVSASLTPLIHFIQLTGGAVGNTATISLFAKADTGSYIQLTNPYSGAIFANFDVATGVVGTKGASCISSDIEDYGNGWYRCIAVFDNTGFNSNIYRHYIVPSASATFGQSWLPASDTSLFIYGHQWEAGSYPTSYIPTYGTAANRGADSNVVITSASDLIGQTEGTIFIDTTSNDEQDGDMRIQLSSGTSTNDWIFLSCPEPTGGGNKPRIYINYNGSTQVNSYGSFLSAGNHKYALAYRENDVVLYVDGVLTQSDTSATIPTCDRLTISGGVPNNTDTNRLSKHKQVLLFKTRLTNAELAALTTI